MSRETLFHIVFITKHSISGFYSRLPLHFFKNFNIEKSSTSSRVPESQELTVGLKFDPTRSRISLKRANRPRDAGDARPFFFKKKIKTDPSQLPSPKRAHGRRVAFGISEGDSELSALNSELRFQIRIIK